MVNIAIAMQNMVLAATVEGLCRVESFDEDEVEEMLKISGDYRVIALGYPRRKLDLQDKILHLIKRKRKVKEGIVSFEEFGEETSSL